MGHLDAIEAIIIALVVTQLVISAAVTAGHRLGIPPPLILVSAGVGVSLIPGLPDFVIDPQIILLGLLPPLLYATAWTPHRPLLIFIAFAVAASSLLVQGGTVGFLVSRLFGGRGQGATAPAPEEGRRIEALLARVEAKLSRTEGTPVHAHWLEVLRAQRHALLDARDDGLIDADLLGEALRDVDVDEIVLEMRQR